MPFSPLSLFTIPIDALLSRGVDNPAAWGFNAPPPNLTEGNPSGLIARDAIASPTSVSSNLGPGGGGGGGGGGGKQIVVLSPPTLRQFVRLLDEKVIHVMSCHVMLPHISFRLTSPLISHPILSHPVLSYPILSYLILSCHVEQVINAMQETVINVLKFFLQASVNKCEPIQP